MKFAKIKQSTFQELQVEAGVLLNTFNPANPVAPADEDIICATTGGITVEAKPEYTDFGEDVDNCPNNTKELKHLDSWTCTISTTALGTSAEAIRLALGAADIDESNTSLVTPRNELKMADFGDIWWVGDRADGGLVAVKLFNALSTEGFSLTTTKKGKGQIGLTLTGHVSINSQDVVPMEFYSIEGDETPDITLNKSTLALTVGGNETLQADVIPVGSTITWTSSSSSVASVNSSGKVTAAGTGTATITAKITVDGVDYTDTCTVTVTAAQ